MLDNFFFKSPGIVLHKKGGSRRLLIVAPTTTNHNQLEFRFTTDAAAIRFPNESHKYLVVLISRSIHFFVSVFIGDRLSDARAFAYK